MSEAGKLWAIAGLALCFRVALSAATPIPAEDGVNILWMAQGFAAGDFGSPLEQVFPPLGALLTAVPIALGVEPFRAGQAVLAVAGAASVWTVGRAAAAAAPGAAVAAAWFVAWAPLPARYGAEIYSEPLFVMLSGLALAAGLRDRPWRCGLWAGIAFWVRPEAVVLPLGFALARGPRFWRSAVPLVGAVAALACWRGSVTGDFHPLPKLVFNLERELDETGAWGANLLRIPGAAIEAYGPLLLLVGYAAWTWRRALAGTGADPAPTAGRAGHSLLSVWVVGILPIVTFAVRRRFLVSWTAVVAAAAAVGTLRMSRGVRCAVFAAWMVYGAGVAWRGLIDEDRAAERDVGTWIAQQLRSDAGPAPGGGTVAGDTVAGDMTRVLWFAGVRPLPPKHFSASELVARAEVEGVRFAVFSVRRDTWPAVRAGLAEWSYADLPTQVAVRAASRGLVVLERPR